MPKHINDIVRRDLIEIELNENYRNNITGIPIGFTHLDKKIGGLQPADLIVVAARPSMGKTTFVQNVCKNVSMLDIGVVDENGDMKKIPNKPVLIFSFEISAEDFLVEMCLSLSHVAKMYNHSRHHLSSNDIVRIAAAVEILHQRSNIYIDDSKFFTISKLCRRAKEIYLESGGLSLIVVDYLQLLRCPAVADNREREISVIIHSLKALAKFLNVPIVLTSQLNRELEERENKRPVISDLPVPITEAADIIMFIYRDEYYNPEKEKNKGIAEIIIGKNRNGETDTINLTFDGRFARFDNCKK